MALLHAADTVNSIDVDSTGNFCPGTFQETIFIFWSESAIIALTAFAECRPSPVTFAHIRRVGPVVKVVKQGGSPDEARLEQTPYPFKPH